MARLFDRHAGDEHRTGRHDDVRLKSATYLKAFQDVEILVSMDSAKLKNLVKGGADARGFGIVENETHIHAPFGQPS